MNDCRTMRAQKSAKQKNVIATTGLIGGLLTGGAAGAAVMVGGVAASGSMTLIEIFARIKLDFSSKKH
jgi:hypothetical protein